MAKVSVLNCSSYDKETVYKTINNSLNLINFRIPDGITVLVKPNVLNPYKPEKAITTHPAIVDAVCRILKQKDCNIIIGDSSGIFIGGSTQRAFKLSGIEAVAKKYNAQLVAFEGSKIITIVDKRAKVLKKITISSIPKNVDLIINLPKLKTHMLTKYTGAVKNMFGCIPGALKQKYHITGGNEKRFSHLLLDIYQNIKPGLNILDGIIGMEGNGPSAGKPKKAGIIIASEDAIALDIIAAKIIGYNPKDIYTNSLAVERGIFDGEIDIVGDANIKINFKKPETNKLKLIPPLLNEIVFNILFRVYPFVDKEKCRKCGVCVKACAAGAITMKPYPEVSRLKCITCFCCHEMCPYAAINLKRPRIMELLSSVLRKITGK